MKKNILIAMGALFISIVSCKKDEEVIIETTEECGGGIVPEAFGFPSKVGTYWLYDINNIDSLGIVHSTGIRDSVVLVGDSLIDGKQFIMLNGSFMGGVPENFFIRDDGQGLVNEDGDRLMSYGLIEDVVIETGEQSVGADEVWNYTLKHRATTGTIFYSELIYVADDGGVMNECGETNLPLRTSYEKGVGNIRSEIVFITAFKHFCERRERVLVDFYEPE